MTDRYPHTQQPGSSSSDLRQSLLKERVAKLPHLPAIVPPRDQTTATYTASAAKMNDDDENDTLGPLAAPSSSLHKAHISQSEYSPVSAEDCFDIALEVDNFGNGTIDTMSYTSPTVENRSNEKPRTQGQFRVYYTPTKEKLEPLKGKHVRPAPFGTVGDGNPDLMSLQPPTVPGDDEEIDENQESKQRSSAGTVFLLLHGAGYSALSFALVAKWITKLTEGNAGVLAYDCRGHGKTQHNSAEESHELSLKNLTEDALLVLRKMFPISAPQPTLVLVGHSMGGAVAVSLAHALMDEQTPALARPRVAGVAVLDVVEGTALAALPSMKKIVSSLPQGFSSIAEAIKWHIESGTIVNPDSARRSVPSLLRRSHQKEEPYESPPDLNEPKEELLSSSPSEPLSSEPWPFVWRHDLLATEPYWQEWFQGLSQSFLTVKCARLLLLAGTDRLDKELMIGQMQGKYQLVVFPDVGHSVQEVSTHILLQYTLTTSSLFGSGCAGTHGPHTR